MGFFVLPNGRIILQWFSNFARIYMEEMNSFNGVVIDSVAICAIMQTMSNWIFMCHLSVIVSSISHDTIKGAKY